MSRRYSVGQWRSLLAEQSASGISISLFWEAKDIPEVNIRRNGGDVGAGGS